MGLCCKWNSLVDMNNGVIIAPPAPSVRSTVLAAMRRVFNGSAVPAVSPTVSKSEGHQAFTDGFPLSVCPYVQIAHVDSWRSGWLDAQRKRDEP